MGETYPRTYADYVLLERLGSGGMSEVDLARKVVDDRSFVRFAVIKRIKADRSTDESFVRMFKDEARITAELHHEKIGTVYDFGRVGDEYYLALEYVAGVDVRHLVQTLRDRGQRVPVKVALRVVADVLDALEYAHNKKDTFGRRMGIVHRDVNPRNIMISIRGEVKLIDFGVAKATDRLERTRTDHVKGKFSYMAPEQITGQSIDHRADLYAVGLTLHELLTGSSPFFGLNQVQVLHRMMAGRPPALPAIPEIPDQRLVVAIHDKALASSPSDRYASAAEMAADVRRLADALGGMPSEDQLAAFLAAVDPDLTARLQLKMETYARLEVSASGEIAAPSVDTTGLQSAVLPEVHGHTIAEQDSLTVTRMGVLGGSVLLVSLFSAILAALFVTAVFVGLILAFGPSWTTPPPAPVAQPVAAPAPVPAPVPVPVPAAEPAPALASPEPAPVEAPVPAPPPRPRRPTPAPEPEPEPVAEPEPAPEPVPEPAPEVVAPPPDPEPAPPPAPLETGLLSVTSDPRGLNVLVDGVVVGSTPLDRFRVPVGRHVVAVEGKACERTVTIQKAGVQLVSCR